MLKLDPTPGQAEALLATMRACNAGATRAAEVAFMLRTANKIRLQGEVYRELRETFGLSAQMAIRAIGKCCDAYKRNKDIRPVFSPLGAIHYDMRMMSWKARDLVSLLTLTGRAVVPVIYQGRLRDRPGAVQRGQANLIYRDGKFYLAIAVEIPDGEVDVDEPAEWLGIDMGVVNIATDSDGVQHSGKGLRAVRRRHQRLRQRLQSKQTKSAKRLLRKRYRKESRFARDANHRISKTLVGKAKDTHRGIALEDLTGIRDRITVRKAQRADLISWSFYQLRMFITYKAQLVGVPVRPVNPRNTSRTCPGCGLIDKRNRVARDDFLCIQCGLAGPADTIAAGNIASRAAAMQPYAA